MKKILSIVFLIFLLVPLQAKKDKKTGLKTGGLVIQKITIYDKYEACLNRVKPCRVKIPLFANREMRLRYQMHIDTFEEKNGKVKNAYLIYINKSSHDTYYFKSFFVNGKEIKNERKKEKV